MDLDGFETRNSFGARILWCETVCMQRLNGSSRAAMALVVLSSVITACGVFEVRIENGGSSEPVGARISLSPYDTTVTDPTPTSPPGNRLLTSFDEDSPIATSEAPVVVSSRGTTAKIPGCLSNEGQPLGMVEKVTLPPVDNEALIAEDRQRDFLSYRSVVAIQVDITPNDYGTWEALSDGSLMWRLRIASPGATSLNFGFTNFWNPDGCLFLYPPDRTLVVGPFRSDGNFPGPLWTPAIKGDEIVIEVTLPPGVDAPLEMELAFVNHGYREGIALDPDVEREWLERISDTP